MRRFVLILLIFIFMTGCLVLTKTMDVRADVPVLVKGSDIKSSNGIKVKLLDLRKEEISIKQQNNYFFTLCFINIGADASVELLFKSVDDVNDRYSEGQERRDNFDLRSWESKILRFKRFFGKCPMDSSHIGDIRMRGWAIFTAKIKRGESETTDMKFRIRLE